jgi:nucleotide-binding universal stress UspA family protein
VALPQRILIPLDGSPHSERCIPSALEFASLSSVHLVFLYVVKHSPAVDSDPQACGNEDDREFLAASTEWNSRSPDAYLRSVSERCVPFGIPTSYYVRFGPIAQTIVEVADENQIDLIALSTHARSGFKRFFMGSVSAQLLQERHVPLMLVSGAVARRLDDSMG